MLRCGSLNVGWIILALGTIGSENRNLQRLSIYIPPDLDCILPEDCGDMEKAIREADPGMQWSDLDRLLPQFLESRPIRARVVYTPDDNERWLGARPMLVWAKYLLPESIKRGIVDLVLGYRDRR